MKTAQRFVEQAAACRHLGSPLYEHLLLSLADDVERSGPTARLLAEHFDEAQLPRLLPLRLLGGLHAAVLQRQAPELATFYPSVGGTAPIGPDLPAAAIRFIVEHPELVRPWLARDPQTNEVGRSAVLRGGLAHAVAAARALAGQDLDVRLMEVGASAGLNLRVDHFRIDDRGPSDSPVRLDDAWQGSPPPQSSLRIVERCGVDLHPVDPTTADGRLRLSAYMWPDDIVRWQRLAGALQVAAEVPAELIAADALDWIETVQPVAGTLTVIWHSVAMMYLSQDDRERFAAAIERVGAAATATAPLAHLRMEPDGPVTVEFPVRLRLWPDGIDRLLAVAAPHGIPVHWD
jgi:hypothetical protein